MATALRDTSINGPMAWNASSHLEHDGVVTLNEVCIDELRASARTLAANPLPITMLQSYDFVMPACEELFSRIKHTLDHGVGFAVVDRLPLAEFGNDVSIKLYWLLLGLLGRRVAQKWDGLMVYDVTDTGLKATAGSGVRSSKTNAGQVYHTDNSFNLPPDYVSLLCIQPAAEGGESGLISFDSVYNRLLAHHPDVIPRLYEPFYFDRQQEHAPDAPLVSTYPVFEYTGTLQTRLATNLIRQGYAVNGHSLDSDSAQALEVLDQVMEASDLGKTFDFESGQIQIVNNRRIGHRRTAFVDAPEPKLKRRLIRLWLRENGRPFYMG